MRSPTLLILISRRVDALAGRSSPRPIRTRPTRPTMDSPRRRRRDAHARRQDRSSRHARCIVLLRVRTVVVLSEAGSEVEAVDEELSSDTCFGAERDWYDESAYCQRLHGYSCQCVYGCWEREWGWVEVGCAQFVPRRRWWCCGSESCKSTRRARDRCAGRRGGAAAVRRSERRRTPQPHHFHFHFAAPRVRTSTSTFLSSADISSAAGPSTT
ncbi:hypothetical protein EXIGLDRAFT_256014 [Exidia glandulosa HHB12029]|uniref:Uncharacterized protein n=1 Tax=Exidia glandulosa HHB12029 TaxID=1314781 RepID=A0A165DVF4_EXIGL|nr:hypothetical protein EXIGLDRAFT_256014 [Exidia glandulosa HHB12029]